MKKLLSLSVMLSLGLATLTPALNAAQSQQDAVAQFQANPADVSGWQAAKKWWQSGRNMKALNPQEQRAFRALRTKFAIGTIIAAIVAIVGGGTAYRYRRYVIDLLEWELIDAAYRGDKKELERLLQTGVDVNAADQDGWTALMYAAYRGHENIVKLLLQVEGIDVNAASGISIIVRGVIVRGIGSTMNGKTIWIDFGSTALMMAAAKGSENIVKMLLDAGADRTMKNYKGQTAENMARNDEIANMIRYYGKDK